MPRACIRWLATAIAWVTQKPEHGDAIIQNEHAGVSAGAGFGLEVRSSILYHFLSNLVVWLAIAALLIWRRRRVRRVALIIFFRNGHPLAVVHASGLKALLNSNFSLREDVQIMFLCGC